MSALPPIADIRNAGGGAVLSIISGHERGASALPQRPRVTRTYVVRSLLLHAYPDELNTIAMNLEVIWEMSV
jgi:hypothetical protein